MADSISPLILGGTKHVDQDFSLDGPGSSAHSASQPASRAPSIRSVGTSRRLIGRSSRERQTSPRLVAADLATATVAALEGSDSSKTPVETGSRPALGALSRAYEAFFIQRLQIQTWVKNERKRRTAKRARAKAARPDSSASQDLSDSDTALEELDVILDRALGTLVPKEAAIPRRESRHGVALAPSSLLFPKSTASRARNGEIEADVPHCEAVLDNSKTLDYADTDPYADIGLPSSSVSSAVPTPITRSSTFGSVSITKNADAWNSFKLEILRIAHTLRLKRWRHIPMELSHQISVDRLSGALTNAVYVVSPPADFVPPPPVRMGSDNSIPEHGPVGAARKVPKLLLRIYGPRVSHLIDRESELAILKRLARHNIGPSLLGTFTNGRFEEFLHAKPLTNADLRDLETSRMVAKRMRELHDSIELLPEEVEAGPMVWRNWEKWLGHCSDVLARLDVLAGNRLGLGFQPGRTKGLRYVCGAPWPVFRDAVERYREWLVEATGGKQATKRRLVFAHNDAQYGNILRIMPEGESSLLLAANKHKQLAVIDFEYANANVRGIEFANHFTEWCYNYHSADAPFACNIANYPRLDEQRNFIKAYVSYSPLSSVQPNRAPPACLAHSVSSPAVSCAAGNTYSHRFDMYSSNLSSSSLTDVRAGVDVDGAGVPVVATVGKTKTEQEKQAQIESETEQLLYETRIWRPANSAQWVAWGIVQAKLPTGDDVAEPVVDSEQDDTNEFDYVAYAQDRAIFFWADIVDLGVISIDELPEPLADAVRNVKIW